MIEGTEVTASKRNTNIHLSVDLNVNINICWTLVTNLTYAHMHVISRCNAIFLTAAFHWPGHENIYCYCTNIQGYHQVCKICGHICTYYCMARNNALTVKVYKKKKKKIYTNNPEFAQYCKSSITIFCRVHRSHEIFFFFKVRELSGNSVICQGK